MNNNNTRAMVEGAIFASITVLIGLISFYIPFLFVLSYFWAIPTIIISYRHGFKISFISGLSAAIIIAMFQGPVSGINTFVITLVPGMFLGFFMKKFKKQQNLILASMAVTVICTIIAFSLGAVIAGVNPIQMADRTVTAFMQQYNLAMESAKHTYAVMGVTPDQLAKIPDPKEVLELMKKLVAVLLMVGGVGSTIFNFWITKKLLHRMKIEIPDLEPITHWHLSVTGLMVVSGCIVFILISMYFFKDNMILMDLSLNMATALLLWFWFLGVATVSFFLNKVAMPKPIKVVIVVVTAIPLVNIYALVGYIEAAFDFRKLRPEIIIRK